MAALIKGANVLIYEDMAGNVERYRLVIKAVNNMGFSGGRVMDVADRSGDFKNELLVQRIGTWLLLRLKAVLRSRVSSGDMLRPISRKMQL